MSRIGKVPIEIPDGVSVDINSDRVEVKGKNATLSVPMLEAVSVEEKDNQILVQAKGANKKSKTNWGTMRSLVNNAVAGASEDFSKKLIVEGVGYRVNMEGNDLVLGLGFSHQIKFPVPEGLKITVEKNEISISGPDKAAVGQAAAKIRSFRKPEPYKGKGVRYSDEIVKRKQGKKAAGS